MGCTGSKHERRNHTQSPGTLSRCRSMPVHHPALWRGDSCHLVSLTSSTLGFLSVDPLDEDEEEEDDPADTTIIDSKSGDYSVAPLPRTPTATPRREPEIIDARELMAGLENASPLLEKSFSFNALPKLEDREKEFRWKKMGISSSFSTGRSESLVRSRIIAFQEKINADRARARVKFKLPDGGKGKVVFYFTSLRGIRKTFEDCCSVREILRGYAIRVDERDVSLHRGFRQELASIFGSRDDSFKLPRVFADGRFLGGAEEIQQLHDEGELAEALRGCEEVEKGDDGSCVGCGGVRFVPCESCSGSCKIYVEYGEFRRCQDCNENGLVRCPVCWVG